MRPPHAPLCRLMRLADSVSREPSGKGRGLFPSHPRCDCLLDELRNFTLSGVPKADHQAADSLEPRIGELGGWLEAEQESGDTHPAPERTDGADAIPGAEQYRRFLGRGEARPIPGSGWLHGVLAGHCDRPSRRPPVRASGPVWGNRPALFRCARREVRSVCTKGWGLEPWYAPLIRRSGEGGH